jgi:hypothetical protein
MVVAAVRAVPVTVKAKHKTSRTIFVLCGGCENILGWDTSG